MAQKKPTPRKAATAKTKGKKPVARATPAKKKNAIAEGKTLTVLYAQIAVFDGRLDNPFNDWTEAHTQQGFSWRSGSVSFRTLPDVINVEVEAALSNQFLPDPQSQRAVSVPFAVETGAAIEIATINDSMPVTIDAGTYQLVYETGRRDEATWVRFTFVPNGPQKPKVLVVDDELNPSDPLVMTAEPA